MKGRKKVIFGIIAGVMVCIGFFFILVRYFFFSKYNVHARREILDRLNGMYEQEFDVLSVEYEPKETDMPGGVKYMYLWKFTCEDREGRKCYAYIRLYGMKKWGEGTLHIKKCPFGHFRKFVKTVGYDEFVGIIKYTGGIYNEIII